MLQKYDVSNLTVESIYVIRIMKQYDYIIDKDYKSVKLSKFNFNGGRVIKMNIIYIQIHLNYVYCEQKIH